MPVGFPNNEIPITTFAALPSAASSNNLTYFVSDIGSGTYFRSNGVIWRPYNGYALLAQVNTLTALTGTVNETTLATYTVAANLMTVSGALRINTVWSWTNNANNKFSRIRFDGTAFGSLTLTTSASFHDQREIRNRNSAVSQVGITTTMGNSWSASSVSPVTAAIDTTLAKNLTLTGQLANAADTITLESYTIELMIP